MLKEAAKKHVSNPFLNYQPSRQCLEKNLSLETLQQPSEHTLPNSDGGSAGALPSIGFREIQTMQKKLLHPHHCRGVFAALGGILLGNADVLVGFCGVVADEDVGDPREAISWKHFRGDFSGFRLLLRGRERGQASQINIYE